MNQYQGYICVKDLMKNSRPTTIADDVREEMKEEDLIRGAVPYCQTAAGRRGEAFGKLAHQCVGAEVDLVRL